MLEKCVLTILELNWNQRLGHKRTKLKICHHNYAHVVHTTAEQVISRRRKNENVFKMSKDEKCTCKACKNTVFHCQICKFVGFLLPSSSWLLKLPIVRSERGRNIAAMHVLSAVIFFWWRFLCSSYFFETPFSCNLFLVA